MTRVRVGAAGGADRDLVPCRACGGCGLVPLPYALAGTLAYVRAAGSATSLACLRAANRDNEAFGDPPLGHTALANRLAVLVELGFLRRVRKRGKAYVYEPTAQLTRDVPDRRPSKGGG
jgi:hypothetical protein